MTTQNFIRKRPHLIWYVKDVQKLSDEAVVEAVLNHGDFDDFNGLMSILGAQRTREAFIKGLRKKRSNYDPKVTNYFKLYFKRHA